MSTTISVRLDDDLEARFEAFLQQHRYQPDKSEVVREALNRFLDEELDADAANSG